GQRPSREMTEIEEQVLEIVMRIICRELQNTWQPLGIEFEFEQRQQAGRLQRLLPGEEKTLGLSLELTVNECRGLMSIAVPAVVSTALLRKISGGHPRTRAQLGSKESADRVRHHLLTCPFRLDMELHATAPSAAELASLVPGQVLPLKRHADGIAELLCGGHPVFQT